MNKILLISTFLITPFLIGCSNNEDTNLNQTETSKKKPVSLYTGYKLPSLLEQSSKPVTLSEITTLLDKKWYAEFNVIQVDVEDKTYTLSTCNSLQSINTKKLNTVRENESAPFLDVLVMCKATKLIAKAKASQKSFLESFTLDETLPKNLPASIGMVISDTESKRNAKNTNLKYWYQVNTITNIIKQGQNHVTYILNDGSQQELELVAKGDFNGDSIEDILITSRDTVQGGSYSATRLFLLTKHSVTGDILSLPLIIQ